MSMTDSYLKLGPPSNREKEDCCPHTKATAGCRPKKFNGTLIT